jgi:hypothetical protein
MLGRPPLKKRGSKLGIVLSPFVKGDRGGFDDKI